MAKFTDSTGRAWRPRITCLVLARYEEETGENPFAMVPVPDGVPPERLGLKDGDPLPERITRLQADLVTMRVTRLTTLAGLACAEDLRAAKLAVEDLLDALETQEQYEGMIGAVAEALADFFQRRTTPQKKTESAASRGAGATPTA